MQTHDTTGEVGHKDHNDLIEVELNGKPKHIPPGDYTGRSLKLALDVPLEHELDEVIWGEFKEIPNDRELKVHRGEKFVSHPGHGKSS